MMIIIAKINCEYGVLSLMLRSFSQRRLIYPLCLSRRGKFDMINKINKSIFSRADVQGESLA